MFFVNCGVKHDFKKYTKFIFFFNFAFPLERELAVVVYLNLKLFQFFREQIFNLTELTSQIK